MSEVHRLSKVVGSSGSGKTTYILGLLEAAARKYDPEKIGAVSYTNSAVNEMKERVSKAGGANVESLRNIRTLHSLCFRLLELKREQVVEGAAKIKEFNDAYPEYELPVDLKMNAVEDPGALNADGSQDRRSNSNMAINLHNFRKMNVFRNLMTPISEWPADVVEFHRTWRRWMNVNNYLDFTAMMEQALEAGVVPDIDVLFVDEAQDTSTIQMRILENWVDRATSSIFVGDSAQAIFRFAASVPENFIHLPATWVKVLEKSYRVPKKILQYAQAILKRYCLDHEETPFFPRDGDEGEFMHGMTEPDLSLDGDHMVLTRCVYQLSEWRDFLIKHGRVWHNPYRQKDLFMNPTRTQIWKAVKTYVMLKQGDIVPIQDILKMTTEMKSTGNLITGMKTKIRQMDDDSNFNWMENVDFRNIGKLGFFTDEFASLRKPISEVFHLKGKTGELIMRLDKDEQMFLKNPDVILGVVHSVKGGESTNVWIDTRTSPLGARMFAGPQQNRNDEARVAYVAATRARQRLGLMHGWKGSQAYMNRAFFV